MGSDYDIAIIELNESVKMNKHINTACLPFLEPNDEITVLISGWGSNGTTYPIGEPNILQKASVDIVSRKQCQDIYEQMPTTPNITDRMICAAREGKGPCQGDSGGRKIVHSFERYPPHLVFISYILKKVQW